MAPSEGHALPDRVVALDQLLQHRLQLVRLGLGQEADLAQVHPEQRDVDLGDGLGRPQEGPVAPEHDQDVRRRQLAPLGVEVARRGRPLVQPAHAAPAPGALPELQGGIVGRVVGEPDASHAHRRPLPGSRDGRLDPVLDLGAGGSGRDPGQELAVALRSPDRRRDDVPRPEPEGPRPPDGLRQDPAMDVGVLHDATLRVRAARLELRLDQRHDGPAAVPQDGPDRPQDEAEGDERDVHDGQVHGLRQGPGLQRPGVDAFHGHDPPVMPEALCELPVAHVQRHRHGRPRGRAARR